MVMGCGHGSWNLPGHTCGDSDVWLLVVVLHP